jgi:hypothetical protein
VKFNAVISNRPVMLNHRHVCLRWKIREISARSLSGGKTGRVNVSGTDPLLSRSFSRRDRSRSLNDRGFVYDPQLAIALLQTLQSGDLHRHGQVFQACAGEPTAGGDA